MNGGMGSRRILKSARMQPLQILWETVIAFPLVALYLDWKQGWCLDIGHKPPSKGVESIPSAKRYSDL